MMHMDSMTARSGHGVKTFHQRAAEPCTNVQVTTFSGGIKT